MATSKQAETTPADPQIVCPVLATLTREGRLNPGADGMVGLGELTQALRSLGLSRTAVGLLDAAAALRGNPGASSLLRNLTHAGTNLLELRDGPLDHKADTGILKAGPFDAERFAQLIAHSSDGVVMDEQALGYALRDNYQRDPSVQGKTTSSVELAAVLLVFGERGPDGRWGISIETLRGLYDAHRLPAGFVPHDVKLLEIMASARRIVAHAA